MNELVEKQITILTKIDEFETQIKELDKLSKQYDELKKDLKQTMVDIAKENGSDKLKWTTNKGIQITLSVGHKAEFTEEEYTEFDVESFKKDFPQMYETYLVKKTRNKSIQSQTSDRLTITLPKENDNE